MARMRMVKPEFWTSDSTTECSMPARLLFIGLWNFCDDRGVHPASVKTLKREVFPDDPLTKEQMTALMGELIANGLVREYQAEGETYWHVVKFQKHQRVDRPHYKYPPPPAAFLAGDGFDDQSPNAGADVDDERAANEQGSIDDRSTSDRPRMGMEGNGDIDPPPTPSRSNPKPKRQSKSARRKRATEEAEAVKALGPEWKPAIEAVRRYGPAEANSAILAARDFEHPPGRVVAFVAVLDGNRDRFDEPAGALVARLNNPEPDPLKGWIRTVEDVKPAKARSPDPERERDRLIAEIVAREKCSPGEAAVRADAELARRIAKGDAA